MPPKYGLTWCSTSILESWNSHWSNAYSMLVWIARCCWRACWFPPTYHDLKLTMQCRIMQLWWGQGYSNISTKCRIISNLRSSMHFCYIYTELYITILYIYTIFIITYTHTRIYIYIHTYIYIYIHTYTYIYIYMYTRL